MAGERVSRCARTRCGGRDRVHVLGAPVQVHDHDPRASAPGAPGVGQDQPGGGPVHRPRVRHRLSVRDRGVGQERHAQAAHAQHRGAPALAGGTRGSGSPHACAVKRAQGRVDPVLAGVERVVRRCAAAVPAHLPDRAREVGRRPEARVALHRPRHERRLDVADGEVRPGDAVSDGSEQRREVVPAPATQRESPLGDRRVDQQVTRRGDGEAHGPLLRRSRRGRRAQEHGEPHEEPPHQRTSCSSMTP